MYGTQLSIILVVLQRQMMMTNLAVRFVDTLESMSWNVTMKKEKQNSPSINDLIRIMGWRTSNMMRMLYEEIEKAILTTKDTRDTSKSILFSDKMLPKCCHLKLLMLYFKGMQKNSTSFSFQVWKYLEQIWGICSKVMYLSEIWLHSPQLIKILQAPVSR